VFSSSRVIARNRVPRPRDSPSDIAYPLDICSSAAAAPVNMPSARKRGLREVNAEVAEIREEPSLLQRIRNMWQFANLCQWISLFGDVVKLDENLDVDVRGPLRLLDCETHEDHCSLLLLLRTSKPSASNRIPWLFKISAYPYSSSCHLTED
jgi:hypothetical protein